MTRLPATWSRISRLALAAPIVLIGLLGMGSPGLAQEEPPSEEEMTASFPLPQPPVVPPDQEEEPTQVQTLADRHRFSPPNEAKDPFKPLVKRPEPKKEEKTIRIEPPPQASEPKPIPPLVLTVSGICGNDAERLAMIIFENKPYVVHKEVTVDGTFKVVDVLADRLVIYSFREQMRRTFPIGGGKE